MTETSPTLKQLISESIDSEAPDDVLYRFVSAVRPPYEVADSEQQAVILLINFSVKRESVNNPLDRQEAIHHLAEKDFQLIKRFSDSIRGRHTHNIKWPLSFLRGNLFQCLPYDEHDPYVHSGSVKLSKRFGYAQNAANIKACKGLLAEFLYRGKLTSMLEEIQGGTDLGGRFMAFLEESIERSEHNRKSHEESRGQKAKPEEILEELYTTISELPTEAFPEVATHPEIFAFTEPGEPELLLSPVAHTGVMREIHIRLSECESWQRVGMRAGSKNDIHTYGDLISDAGGYLHTLKALPPIEKKGEFRRLIDQLTILGHLYDTRSIKHYLLKIGGQYVDESTGEVRNWTDFRENKWVKSECSKVIHQLFRDYRKLMFYLRLGRKIPNRCQTVIDKSEAQRILTTPQTTYTSETIKKIIGEAVPKLVSALQQLADHEYLPLTDFHQKALEHAIINYFRSE